MYIMVGDVGINQVLFTGAFHEVNVGSLYYIHIYTSVYRFINVRYRNRPKPDAISFSL